ncbi:hypothetical protein D910_03670, partial [Dendroctonus ponderosae]
LVVRFITRRFIGEYDPTLEKNYSFHTVIDNDMVYFEILDTAGQTAETEFIGLEANIRWAEAFILMYSVTDKCSFDECYRLKFLINYNKRKKRLGSTKDPIDVPVLLVGNKNDQIEERMVSLEDGQKRRKALTSDKDPESPECARILCSSVVSPSSLTPYNGRTTGILDGQKLNWRKKTNRKLFKLQPALVSRYRSEHGLLPMDIFNISPGNGGKDKTIFCWKIVYDLVLVSTQQFGEFRRNSSILQCRQKDEHIYERKQR